MLKQESFSQTKKRYFKTLGQYLPTVERVHGGNHPEIHEVRSIFEVIVRKTQEAGSQKPELHEEFTKLREITHGYSVPRDVCESYEAVYRMLGEIDDAYQA